MKKTISIVTRSFVAVIFLTAVIAAYSQSSDQTFPTAITTNEIRGRIKARDIGDSRLTTYFYAFNGEQGDVFVNVTTRNFDGDIDIFNVDGLRPLTKIVIFADPTVSETGRIVYLRKAERLLLRIEGRTPDDNPATFLVKFAGSFVALKPTRKTGDAGPPEIDPGVLNGVRVNSIGTIVETQAKPKVDTEPKIKIKEPTDETTAKTPDPENAPAAKPRKPLKKIVEEQSDKETVSSEIGTDDTKTAEKPKTKAPKPPRTAKSTTAEKQLKSGSDAKNVPDPLASIHLVIVLKEGKTIERRMSEVLRFSVDKGIMTIIAKDGTIVRYAITDVAKVTIE